MVTTYCGNVILTGDVAISKLKGILHDNFNVPIFRVDNILYFNLPLTEAFVSIVIESDSATIDCPAFGFVDVKYTLLDEADMISIVHQYKIEYESYFKKEATEKLTLLMIANLANHKGLNIKVTPYREGCYLVYFNKAFRIIDTYNAAIINNKLNALLLK